VSITIHADVMLFGFEQGDTSLFIWSRGKEMLKLNSSKMDDHDDRLSATDYHPVLGLYVSVGLDRYVRIFNLKKEMLKEIKFPQPVNAVCFLNTRGDIIVGHSTKVSIIMVEDLKLDSIADNNYPLHPSDLDHFYKNNTSVRGKTFWKLFVVDRHGTEASKKKSKTPVFPGSPDKRSKHGGMLPGKKKPTQSESVSSTDSEEELANKAK